MNRALSQTIRPYLGWGEGVKPSNNAFTAHRVNRFTNPNIFGGSSGYWAQPANRQRFYRPPSVLRRIRSHIWYRRQDLNLHAFQHYVLSVAWLPLHHSGILVILMGFAPMNNALRGHRVSLLLHRTIFGAQGRTRTGTTFQSRVFKTRVSTIPPLGHFGWEGWIRTIDNLFQRQASCHLTTSQQLFSFYIFACKSICLSMTIWA